MFCMFTCSQIPDYCVVVFFIILIISIIQWFVDGKKNFTGPRVDVQNGEVIGVDASQEEESSFENGKIDKRDSLQQ